jgi:hypothetical protein
LPSGLATSLAVSAPIGRGLPEPVRAGEGLGFIATFYGIFAAGH